MRETRRTFSLAAAAATICTFATAPVHAAITTSTIDVNAGGFFGRFFPLTTTFTVSGLGPSLLDMQFRFSAGHTFDGDIRVFLEAPNGTNVEVTSGNGGFGDHYQDTLFGDDAPVSITAAVAPFASPPWPGGATYRPEVPFALLSGIDPNGTWTLRVSDTATGDDGFVFRAGEAAPWGTAVGTQLIIDTDIVPTPSSLLVLGAGAVTLARRRR